MRCRPSVPTHRPWEPTRTLLHDRGCANWARLIDAGDINALPALFDSAAVWVDEEGMIAGKEAILLRRSGLFAVYKASGAVLKSEQVQTSGAWGHVIATFSTTWTARDPRAVPPGWPAIIAEHSRYVCTIHRAGNGKWQIARFTYYPIG